MGVLTFFKLYEWYQTMQRIKYENLNMAKNKRIFSQIKNSQTTSIIAKIRGYVFRLRRMKKKQAFGRSRI